MKIYDQVSQLISEEKSREAIDALIAALKDKNFDLHSDAVGILQRYLDLERARHKEIISFPEYTIQRNKLFFDLQNLAVFADENPDYKKDNLPVIDDTAGKGSDEKESDKTIFNIENAGVVGNEINISGEYASGGNMEINLGGKDAEEDDLPAKKLSEAENSEMEGLKKVENILVEKINLLREQRVLATDINIKYQYKAQIEEVEKELKDVRYKIQDLY